MSVDPTRVETPGGQPVPPTRRETGPPADDHAWGLPPELARRFPDAAARPASGGEADLFDVTGDGERRLLKLYRQGIEPVEDVRRVVGDLSPGIPEWVTVHEAGTAGGRHFEIQEFVTGGHLDIGRGWGTDAIRAVVDQVARALTHLHAHRVVHRDLKPGNILVRDDTTPSVAVTDFGISRRIDATAEFHTGGAGTVAYMPPEAFTRPARVSAAWDWWSLGMLVTAMATGRDPADGFHPEVFGAHVVTKAVDLSGVVDERLRLLCRGLLVRDPEHRWSGAEVRTWLAGGDPPVREDGLPRPPRRGFGEGRPVFDDERTMARAIASDWAVAEAYLRPVAGLPVPGRAAEFRRVLPNGSPARCAELAAAFDGAAGLTTGMVRLIAALDPEHPPACRGVRLDGTRIAEVASAAVDHGKDDHDEASRLVAELADGDLMWRLTAMPGGHTLLAVAHNWRHYVRRWRDAHSEMGEPSGWLLYLAADRGRALDELDERLLADRRLLDVGWFAALVHSADPVDHVVALHRIGHAAREAEAA